MQGLDIKRSMRPAQKKSILPTILVSALILAAVGTWAITTIQDREKETQMRALAQEWKDEQSRFADEASEAQRLTQACIKATWRPFPDACIPCSGSGTIWKGKQATKCPCCFGKGRHN
jgi:hypothetical protein